MTIAGRKGSLLPKGNKASGERITTTARTVWRGREGRKEAGRGREGGDGMGWMEPEEDGESQREDNQNERIQFSGHRRHAPAASSLNNTRASSLIG